MDFLNDFQSPNEKCYHYLPIELYQEILERSEFINQIRLTQLNKYLHINLKIYDFYNIQTKYILLLSDDILKNYRYIKKLNAYNITDKGISHINLHTLNAACYGCQITNNGILHMNLHTLIATCNNNITDEGILHMNLHTLDASYNPNITDEGIAHMNLHTLNACSNSKITDEGIKHMNL